MNAEAVFYTCAGKIPQLQTTIQQIILDIK
jgi:hypothetical protein